MACIAVIAIHSVGTSTATLSQGPIWAWITQHLIVSFSIWAVPLFVMISGALLLTPAETASSSASALTLHSMLTFYKKRFVRLGLPILIWIPAYWIFYHFWLGESLGTFWQLIQVGPFYHLYFLLIIFELSLITPILRQVTYHTGKWGVLATALLFLYIGIYWSLNPFSLNLFIPYIGYYLLGSALMQFPFPSAQVTHKLTILLCALFLLLGGVIFLLNYFSTTINETTYVQDPLYYHHLNPFVIALTVTTFLLIQHASFVHRLFQFFSLPALREISRATLGMYILHPFVLALTLRALQSYFGFSAPPALLMLLFIPYTFFMSYSLTKFVEMVPGVRRSI